VVETHDIVRPPAELSAALATIGRATASGELSRMGIRSAFIRGPVSVTPGVRVAGPALTLQFLPKREDLYPVEEYEEPEKQLHRHVMYHAQPGDMIVVDARGDMESGVFVASQVAACLPAGGRVGITKIADVHQPHLAARREGDGPAVQGELDVADVSRPA
jgi:regulator of RNase E activity RraA